MHATLSTRAARLGGGTRLQERGFLLQVSCTAFCHCVITPVNRVTPIVIEPTNDGTRCDETPRLTLLKLVTIELCVHFKVAKMDAESMSTDMKKARDELSNCKVDLQEVRHHDRIFPPHRMYLGKDKGRH